MSYFTSPEFLRVLLLGFITSVHITWRNLVNSIVPAPYLDEIFHVPQVQAYWNGRWSHWDPKITTPPGLYGFSYAVNAIRATSNPDFKPTTDEWRNVNIILLYVFLVALYILAAVGRKSVNHENVLQREFNIVLFPLIFFFSGLYYTDLFSVFTVVVTQTFWSAGTSAQGLMKFLFQLLHVLAGLVSLAARQTNIFWVAVFLGGLQVVESVKTRIGADRVHDPPMSDAYFEDFPITSISIAQSAIPLVPRLVLDLWPQLMLLVSFGMFVFWNGGVVLGDKDNHIATVHLTQMLYIWPLIVFFSWPVLLPRIASPDGFRKHFPRLTTVASFVAIMLVIVHTNTIVHPFTLADNRHYNFYVFRILLRHWSIKYTVVPIYLVCAWLVLGALGGKPEPQRSKEIRILYGADTVCVSFTLVWFISTSLSLITAPLVEPRYFLIPWLMWRLAVPEVSSTPIVLDPSAVVEKKAKKGNPTTSLIDKVLKFAATYSLWLELAWYVVINVATGYMFLYKGFTWPQEPGEVQRFMW